jgi:hypothetical protein
MTLMDANNSFIQPTRNSPAQYAKNAKFLPLFIRPFALFAGDFFCVKDGDFRQTRKIHLSYFASF